MPAAEPDVRVASSPPAAASPPARTHEAMVIGTSPTRWSGWEPSR